MPYTLEELQGIDFYQEFSSRKLIEYFKRIVKSAVNATENNSPIPFKKDGVDYVSFEDVVTGLGLEEGDFNSDIYNLFLSSTIDAERSQLSPQGSASNPSYSYGISATRNYISNILNAEYNAWWHVVHHHDSEGMPVLNSEVYNTRPDFYTTPQDLGAPEQIQESDFHTAIRTLLESKGKHSGYYPNYKNSKLEGIIDRNIDELSTSEVAVTLPNGVSNGSVVISSENDTRKWLIENNQKRVFPTIESFWGTSYSFSDIITVVEAELNKIPDGDPVD